MAETNTKPAQEKAIPLPDDLKQDGEQGVHKACKAPEDFGSELPCLLELVSKIGSASRQALTHEVRELLIFCHEETAEAVDGRAVATD
jgi:hypothetical protein